MKVRRNSPCPCGSGFKSKKCCFKSQNKIKQHKQFKKNKLMNNGFNTLGTNVKNKSIHSITLQLDSLLLRTKQKINKMSYPKTLIEKAKIGKLDSEGEIDLYYKRYNYKPADLNIKFDDFSYHDLDPYHSNILFIKDGEYLVITLLNKKKKLVAVHLQVKQGGNKIVKKIFFKSERRPRYWEWVKYEKIKGKNIYSIYHFDEINHVVIKTSVNNSTENIIESFSSNRIIYNKMELNRKKMLCQNLIDLDDNEVVGTDKITIVFYEIEMKKLCAIDYTEKKILWEKTTLDRMYSTIYRGMVVSCKEEYIEARDLESGNYIAKTELPSDNSWAYSPPVEFEGDLYVTSQDGFVWKINFISNKSIDEIDMDKKLNTKLTPNHIKNSEIMFDLMLSTWKLNKNSGIQIEPVLQYSNPLFRFSPVVIQNTLLFIGKDYITQKYKFLFITLSRPLEEETLKLTMYRRDSFSQAVEWLYSHLGNNDGKYLSSLMKKYFFLIKKKYSSTEKELPGSINKIFRGNLETFMGTALFRCRKYYEKNILRSFYNTYPFPKESETTKDSFDNSSFDDIIKNTSVAEFFSIIYNLVKNAFVFTRFPTFNDYFFGNRKEIYNKIKIDYKKSKISIDESEISDRAKYLLEKIKNKGGLINFPTERDTNKTVFKKLGGLSSTDRAFLYENNYFHFGQMNRTLANNTFWAFFESGKPGRALYYLLLTDLFPDKSTSSSEDMYFMYIEYLIRVMFQYLNFGENSSPKTINEVCTEEGKFFKNGIEQSFEFYYGADLRLGEVQIERDLVHLDKYINDNDVSKANELFDELHEYIIKSYITEIENESLQVSFIEKIYPHFIDLICLNISEELFQKAFEIFEDYKSQILKLYLSSENRKELLNRIKNEPFYKSLLKKMELMQKEQEQNSRNNIMIPSFIKDNNKSLRSKMYFDSLIPINTTQTSNSINPNEVIIEYFISELSSGVFIIKNENDIEFFDIPILKDAEKIIHSLKRGILSKNTAMSSSMRNIQLLKRLYDILIKPVEPVINNYDTLVIIPTSFLYDVPFNALHTGEHYLINQYYITINPSFGIYQICKSAKTNSSKNINFVCGDDKDLIGINNERDYLLKKFKGNIKLINSVSEFYQSKIDGILHISSHGVFNEDEPFLSSIVLSKSQSLSLLDIYSLDFSKIELAVLNTCFSGKSKTEAGDEIFGIVRGCITAGVPSIINTLWKLDDSFASAFTEKLYDSLDNMDSSIIGFTNAVRSFIDHREYSNPYYWACYQYYGKK